jgi:CDP-diacylglycerol--glycerol-3-phosphate 3-phosphatidyltransferase
MKHVPNTLTVGRILAAPVALYLLWTGTFAGQFAGATLFILAAITDWLDGRLARTYGVSSRLGQFLDPLADKILVLGAFFLIPFLDPIGRGLATPAGEWLPWFAIAMIAVRDVAVTALRTVYERQGRSLTTSNAAKWKTAWQLTFLISAFVFLTASHARMLDGPLGALGRFLHGTLAGPGPLVFLLVTAGVTVYTGVLYFRGASAAPGGA